MQEKKKVTYREGLGSVATHLDYTFTIDLLLHLAESKPMEDFPIQRLAWMFLENQTNFDDDELEDVNTVYPIIIMKMPVQAQRSNQTHYYVVLDGYRRLCKAVKNGRTKIKVRKLTFEEIQKAHQEPISKSSFWKNYPH